MRSGYQYFRRLDLRLHGSRVQGLVAVTLTPITPYRRAVRSLVVPPNGSNR